MLPPGRVETREPVRRGDTAQGRDLAVADVERHGAHDPLAVHTITSAGRDVPSVAIARVGSTASMPVCSWTVTPSRSKAWRR